MIRVILLSIVVICPFLNLYAAQSYYDSYNSLKAKQEQTPTKSNIKKRSVNQSAVNASNANSINQTSDIYSTYKLPSKSKKKTGEMKRFFVGLHYGRFLQNDLSIDSSWSVSSIQKPSSIYGLNFGASKLFFGNKVLLGVEGAVNKAKYKIDATNVTDKGSSYIAKSRSEEYIIRAYDLNLRVGYLINGSILPFYEYDLLFAKNGIGLEYLFNNAKNSIFIKANMQKYEQSCASDSMCTKITSTAIIGGFRVFFDL